MTRAPEAGRWRLVVSLAFVATGACSREPVATTVEWQGHALREVRSLAEIPAAVQTSLGVGRPGVEGVADRGRPFNPTDVVDFRRLPMRRLLTAGSDGDTWLVALERGGRAYYVEVLAFSAGAAPGQKWVLPVGPKTLAEVVHEMSHGGRLED